MGNILRNDIENRNSVEELSISEISQMLNIETNELLKRKKRTSTATVRSIIKMLYPCPEPSFTYTSIDKSIIDAIISKFKLDVFLKLTMLFLSRICEDCKSK